MIRLVPALFAVLLLSAAADARPRVIVTTPNQWVPGPALYWFSQNICAFVAWSVAPDWPAERQALMLGKCPPRPAPRFSA
jgi:hypothetical protein